MCISSRSPQPLPGPWGPHRSAPKSLEAAWPAGITRQTRAQPPRVACVAGLGEGARGASCLSCDQARRPQRHGRQRGLELGSPALGGSCHPEPPGPGLLIGRPRDHSRSGLGHRFPGGVLGGRADASAPPGPRPPPPAPGVGRPLLACTLPECIRVCGGRVLRPLAVPLGLYHAASLDSRAPARLEWRVGLVKQKDRSLSRNPLSLWSTVPCLAPWRREAEAGVPALQAPCSWP